jgi:hypothetical protein
MHTQGREIATVLVGNFERLIFFPIMLGNEMIISL